MRDKNGPELPELITGISVVRSLKLTRNDFRQHFATHRPD